MSTKTRSSTRSSLASLPTLPSGREIAYDHHRISDFNEFASGLVNDGELEAEEDNEEGLDNGVVYRGDMVDYEISDEEGGMTSSVMYKGGIVDIQVNGEGGIEMGDYDDGEEGGGEGNKKESPDRQGNEKESPDRQEDNQSINLDDIIEDSPGSNECRHVSFNNKLYIRNISSSQLQPSEPNDDVGSFDSREESESERPGEEEQSRQPTTQEKEKKKLTPAKKRRRCILAISLLIFCLGTAGAGTWFLVFYLEDKRDYAVYESPNEGNVNDKPSADNFPEIQPIGEIFDTNRCAPLSVEIKTDRFGNETTWTLVYVLDSEYNIDNNVQFERKRLRHHGIERLVQESQVQSYQQILIATGGPYVYYENSTDPFMSTHCLYKGSYKFDIYDANGDGLCCKYDYGYYSLYFVRGQKMVHSSSFELGRIESILFDVTPSDILEAQETDVPSVSPWPTASYAPSIVPSFNEIASSNSDLIKNMKTAVGPELLTNVSKSYGIIFDITTHRNISSVLILGFDLLVFSTEYVDYEVLTMSGSWRDIYTNKTSLRSIFERVANGTILGQGVCGDCGFTTLPIDGFQHVMINHANAVQTFWVNLSSDNLVLMNTFSEKSCDSFAVNDGSAVLLESSESVNSAFDLIDSKGFIGVIHYQSMFRDVTGTDNPTPSPLSDVIYNNTNQPMMPAPSSTFNFSTSPTNWDYSSNFTDAAFTSAYPTPAITDNNAFNFTTLSGEETTTINDTFYITVDSPYYNGTNSSWELPDFNSST